jgi:hypothetical protein
MEGFLTPKELASRWKGTITEKTLANWRSQGDGPPYTKIGGRVMYRLADVIKWENSRTILDKAAG